MIVFDTETTGLIENDALPLDKLPEIIEFGAVKLDDKTLVQKGEIEFLCKPRQFPIPPVITKITGITNEMLQDKPPFRVHIPKLQEFFLGETIIVAHNCTFDCEMTSFELRRVDKQFRFPWPHDRRCTVEITQSIKGHRLKLGELFEIAMGGKMKEAHRALPDVKNLAQVVRWLRKQKKI